MDGLKGFVKELKKEERDIKASLRAVEDALDALKEFGADVDAKELLTLAKQERAELKAELKRIRQKKDHVGVQRTRVKDASSNRKKRTVVRSINKIVPIVHESAKSEAGDRGRPMEKGSMGSDTSDDDVEVPVRPQKPVRRRKIRVVRRVKRVNKVKRKLSTRFLKKIMEYHARKQRLKRTAAALEQGQTHSL